jgi:mRNA interferase MazF
LNFDPTVGHEQAGVRPALVLTPYDYNSKTGLAVMCPVTSRTKGYLFEVPVPAGLAVYGYVLADAAKSLDWRTRSVSYLGDAPLELVDEVLSRLVSLLETED